MPNAWFRMYAEILDDEKVQMMTFEEQRHLVMLFALRCQRPTENMTEKQISFRLRTDETFLKRLHETFMEHGFVAQDWSIINWNKRQFISDSSTERVRKCREKSALKRVETFLKRDETENVTAPEQIQNRTEQKNTSRRKRASDDGINHSADPRHIACKEMIFAYYRTKNGGKEPPWNGQEGKALGMLLGSDPAMDAERMRKLLYNRFRSEVVHSQRPGSWIGRIHDFADGPIDRFNKPLNGNSNGKPSQPKPRLWKPEDVHVQA